MNPAAESLNKRLEGTIIRRMLSNLGEKLYFPRGIVAQAAEAAARAHRFDATVGMAYTHGHPIILDAISEAVPGIPPKQIVGYSPTSGNAELRSRWQAEIRKKNPSLKDARMSKPMVTAGLTNGLNNVADLFFNPGDTLLLPDQYWGNYNLMFGVRHGIKIVTYPFFTADGHFNVEAMAKAVKENQGPRGVKLLLNFPNNPTGYTPSCEDAARIAASLAELADDGDIMVVCDDAYFGLFYEDGIETESMFARCAKLHPRILAVKIDGATKEDYVWGFRIGFMTIANPQLTDDHYAAWDDKLIGSLRSSISNSNTLGQSLLLKAMDSPGYATNKEAIEKELRSRYLIVRDIVKAAPYSNPDFPLKPLPFNSGYFMAFECTLDNAEQLRLDLLDKGIGTIAIGNHVLRVAYAGVDQQFLPELYEIIAQAAAK
ncbi:MAG: aminotransferase class I/II-fold pyridoxal phosphate-dependent enzyme [Spirochaetaceae bacterium]|nr:MAG: aminotransferase class I/II-fold pyridoxal phosphate-dependent enzyme [Spirochaetaceae bacterium]